MHERARFGQWGEDEACRYLIAHGYKIIARNYRCNFGEIDIIADKKNELTFIEVKSRQTLKFGLPAEAVTKTKQAKIHHTAFDYLQKNSIRYEMICFDVIEIFLENGIAKLNHIEHCF